MAPAARMRGFDFGPHPWRVRLENTETARSYRDSRTRAPLNPTRHSDWIPASAGMTAEISVIRNVFSEPLLSLASLASLADEALAAYPAGIAQ